MKVKTFEDDSSGIFSRLKNHEGLCDFEELGNNSIISLLPRVSPLVGEHSANFSVVTKSNPIIIDCCDLKY